jgi:hypothetical protein
MLPNIPRVNRASRDQLIRYHDTLLCNRLWKKLKAFKR